MKFQCIDHVVLTTKNLDKCLAFYRDLMGLPCSEQNGRWTIHLGESAIKIHCRPGEYQPAAGVPTAGSLDICLKLRETEFPAGMALEIARNEIADAGWEIVCDIGERTGANGPMESFYVRDPDGNLVEIMSCGIDD